MRTFLIFCLFLSLSLSPAHLLAGEGTVPEPVLPLMFRDITFTPSGDTVGVQLGISDWDLGVDRATIYLLSLSAQDSITLTYDSTDAVFSTTNTTWLANEISATPGTWTLRQVYAKDGAGRELNLFFQGDIYSFTVAAPAAEEPTEEPTPQHILYLPQVSN